MQFLLNCLYTLRSTIPGGGSLVSSALGGIVVLARRFPVLLLALFLPCRLFAQSAPAVDEWITHADVAKSAGERQLLQFLLHADPAAPGFGHALEWLRHSASLDSPHAEFVLGYLYQQGRGVPRDYAKAAENYQASALHDNSFAQNNLGFLYQHGLGVPRDPQRAFALYLAAAQQNNASAQSNLATMYYTGSGVPRDDTQAARWFRSAAQLGDAEAQHDLAVFYSEGKGVEVNFKEAARWEELSARQGYVLAETGLALLYLSGKGVPLDYVSAHAWFSRAVASGDRSAVAPLKSLSRIMTPKQLDRARIYLASLPPASSTPSVAQAAPPQVPDP